LTQALVAELRKTVTLVLREKLKGKNPESESTETKYSHGLTHSSEEVSVMEMERMG